MVVNGTVADPTGASYLTVHPADATSRPTASSINFRPGEIRSDNVTVALPTTKGVGNLVALFNNNGTVQVVVDVLGYYDPAAVGQPTGARYVPLAEPFRALDTRTDNGAVGPKERRTVAITGDETVPEGVTAAAVNVTAVDPTGQGYLTAARNSDGPLVSTVNYGTDPVTPNFAIVPVLQDPETRSLYFVVRNSIATTQIVVDVLGYYSTDASTGLLYAPVAPQRLVDTRVAQAPSFGPDQTRAFGTEDYRVTIALNLNVTAVDATNGTYLTVFDDDGTRPGVSTLNVFGPFALANAVQTVVSYSAADDTVAYSVYNLAGRVDVVVDLQGYFTAAD